ncbi:hypothetical protein CSV71_05720 [Sporosarcina sp. P21c]|uniref:hypothetical protein n=1 Tax=Sporosarcina TaxID=1569 RepID=UPI000A1687A6|nr:MULTISPECIES: hypothetical protein [Sporosarcina]ARJ38317.1 hypothetical protein SporoP8_05135 [Sporosarcina ureae]PIC82985.1 hypothetical protein CSV73_09675 [Sporosarcina sp. P1]PIC90199.1 hypothetical protein CSV71_05720 [Sporosarcina sp. P21c]
MRKAWKLADFRKLSGMEIPLYILMFFAVPISLTFHSKLPILFIFYMVFAIVLFLAIWYRKHKKERTYPKYYGISLSFFLTVSIAAFYSLLTPNLNAAGYGYVIGFFAYLAAVYILLIYLFNFIYFLVLKRVFPSEKENNEDEVEELSLKEISKTMDLDRQKQYLNITIVNSLLSVILIAYFTLFGMKKWKSKVEFEESQALKSLFAWLENQDSITLFNGVSLLSIVITIYALTFSAQIKIFDEAKKKYTEEY